MMNLAITMYVDKRDWRTYNRMLVERGRTSTYVKTALANYEADLPQMNTNKVGAPYLYTDMLVIAGYAVKIIFKLGYRGAAGMLQLMRIDAHKVSRFQNSTMEDFPDGK